MENPGFEPISVDHPDWAIRLRPLEQSDIADLTRSANNFRIAEQLRDAFPHPYTEDDARVFIGMCRQEKPLRTLGIEVEGRISGAIGAVPKEDVYRLNAEIGYWLAESYWGRGVMTRVIPVFTGFVFRQFAVEKLYAEVLSKNPASMRVLEKCGFRKEAVLLRNCVKNGEILDEHRFVIFRNGCQDHPDRTAAQ